MFSLKYSNSCLLRQLFLILFIFNLSACDSDSINEPEIKPKPPIAQVHVSGAPLESGAYIELSKNEIVTLNGQASTTKGSHITEYEWSTGEKTAVIQLSADKETKLSLIVIDDNGLRSDEFIINIRVIISNPNASNQAPLAIISYLNQPYANNDSITVEENQVVTLSALESTDSDGTVTSFAWSNGDISASTQFTVSKNTSVSLMVTDNQQKQSAVKINVLVIAKPSNGITVSRIDIIGKNSMAIEETLNLSALVTYSDDSEDESVIWSVDDAKLAEIDEHGKLTAKALGQVTITASRGGIVQTHMISITQEFAYLHYLRKDGDYTDWGLLIWSNQGCDGAKIETSWSKPLMPIKLIPELGAVYEIPLKSDATCINYIIHKGDQKESQMPNGTYPTWRLADGKNIYVASGKPDPDSSPIALSIYEDEQAIFINENTIAVPSVLAKQAKAIELHYSLAANISYNDVAKEIIGSTLLSSLSPATLSDAAIQLYPHLASYQAFTINLASLSIQELLKAQLHLVFKKADNSIFNATGLQLAPVLDAVFAKTAQDETLGAVINNSGVRFKLWAPTAQAVLLYLYDETFAPINTSPAAMQANAMGIWTTSDLDVEMGTYYRYQVSVYHPGSKQIETLLVTDPYSLSLSTNSLYSQVVDLTAEELKPADWDIQTIPALQRPEQHVIYETHLRDLTMSDAPSGSRKLDGKYMAITETERDSVRQLAALANAGMNTIHLINMFDIATVNEDETKRIDLDNTVAELCALIEYPAKDGLCKTGGSNTLRSILEAADPATGSAQAVMNALRTYDSFNWGYDPFHYTTPEGSYATDPQGTTRILEYRTLIKTLHDMGFRVVMDVVYNHTTESGLSDKSVLDKIVPAYYQRLNAKGGVESSTCCSNTATENIMMAKLMTDSLMTWTEHYKIDGFRFDLMGHQPKKLMVDALAKVKTIDPDNYFYGEGWNYGEVQNNARFVQASQYEMAGTGIGTFSERLRDAMRGGSPFDSQNNLRMKQGFANAALWNELTDDKRVYDYYYGSEVTPNTLEGEELATADLLEATDLIRLGMAGNLQSFILLDNKGQTKRGQDVDYNGQKAAYTLDPQENISFVSKHYNQTLWDNNMYKAAKEFDSADRARMQIIALSAPILGQGLPFFQLGSELLRSKSMQRDSYDSGDWFNAVHFDMSENNWNVGLPREDKDGANWDLIKTIITDPNAKPRSADIRWTDTRFKELLGIRTSSALFSLETAEQVKARVDFWNTGDKQIPGLIVMSIDDGLSAGADLDPNVDAIVVIINATNQEQAYSIKAATGFMLHDALLDSQASVASDSFSVPALSTAVFVKKQGLKQGSGLAINTSNKDYSDIPPFDSPLYLQGNDNVEIYFTSNGRYQVGLELPQGQFDFAIANQTGLPELRFADVSIDTNSLAINEQGDDFSFNVEKAGYYLFEVNAQDKNNISLAITTIEKPSPFADTALYLRGSIVDSDWRVLSDEAKFEYVGHDTYELEFELKGGAVEARIADKNWTYETNFGGNQALQLDQALTLEVGDASGAMICELKSGLYLFSLNVGDPKAPILSVSELE